jgi:hypothetical protein
MGMNAYVLGVGPFSDGINDCLSYPVEYYRETESGRLVTTSLFHCATTALSGHLAELLEIDRWDFNAHHLNALAIVKKWDEMSEDKLNDLYILWGDEYMDNFIRLAKAGFTMIYMPGG